MSPTGKLGIHVFLFGGFHTFVFFFHDLTMTEISEVMQSSEDPNCPSFSIRDDPLERPSHLFRRK